MLGSLRDPCRNACRTFAVSATALLSWALGAFCGELAPVSDYLEPSLRLPAISGQTVDLADFAGRVVLVNFWAGWCTPCIEEMPSIQRLARKLHDEPFAVIGVNVSESKLRVRAMAQRLGLDFPILLDEQGEVFKSWGATILPTTYVLDGDGVPRYVGRGPLEWDGVEALGVIKGLLDATEPGTAPNH